MTTQHPITPPPELAREWDGYGKSRSDAAQILATQAARWGWEQRGAANEAELQKARDEEMEACVEWLILNGWGAAVNRLRVARRPKPPSLKEAALADVGSLITDLNSKGMGFDFKNILCALEQLDD